MTIENDLSSHYSLSNIEISNNYGDGLVLYNQPEDGHDISIENITINNKTINEYRYLL